MDVFVAIKDILGLPKTKDKLIYLKNEPNPLAKQRAAELLIANKELAFQNQEISYISYHDFLTNLYNRTYFEEEKKRLDTARQLPISIIMGDINGLKLINDGFGHSKGDALLIEVAKILKSCCREEDIVARIGGMSLEFCFPKQIAIPHSKYAAEFLSIVDSFAAMTNDRAYRKAMTRENAIEEIRRNSGTQFDPNISQLFISMISR